MTLPSVGDATPDRLSVIIVDDESVARARLRRLLSDESDVDIVAECSDGKQAVTEILAHAPSLVFLDVEMPELSGFRVLDALPDAAIPNFVFVTAFNHYALDAFAVDALDYLLKPFDAERFQVTLQRARARKRAGAHQRDLLRALREIVDTQREIKAAVAPRTDAASIHQPREEVLERLSVRSDGRTFFVRVEEIDYIEAAANYVRLHVGGARHMIRQKVGELATRLDPTKFARIHRGTIVNLDRIKEIQPWFSGDALVILKSGVKLRMSRLYRSSLDLQSRSRSPVS